MLFIMVIYIDLTLLYSLLNSVIYLKLLYSLMNSVICNCCIA